MIKLEIEDYCQDCDWFEPVLNDFNGSYDNMRHHGGAKAIVQCERQKHCARLVRYLERKLENDGNQD